ncbi:hypothetical protein [Deinococcus sp. YIM 134068]|uniref:hypothetical protein n=1 Tax=Deinococcus lichenicola TaxID=3118910 RepID=UPI002F9545D3
MSVRHPAKRKKELREMLAIDRTLTTVQLERLDLLTTAQQMGLVTVDRTCRTRVTQPGSQTELRFVVADPSYQSLPSSTLMHWAGVAETRGHIGEAYGPLLQLNTLTGRERRHLPDAEIHVPDGRVVAVEFDAGYPREVIAAKLRAASNAGYSGLIWGTSVRARAATVPLFAREMRNELPGLQSIHGIYIDFWSPGKPYAARRYSQRKDKYTVTLHRPRASGSGARVGSR